MDSALLSRPGAVPGEGVDAGVAAHYGDPLREQRTLDAGEGAVDLSHRAVVRVSGPDRLPFLHALTTQALTDLAPDRPTEALVLSPHGHVEHHLHLVDDGASTWLHGEPGTGPALAAFLDSMRFMLRVEVAEETAGRAVVYVPAAGGYRLVPRAELVEYVEGHGRPAGVGALEALRVADGRPRLGRDTDSRTIPQEVGWLRAAVHLDKGCYRGQETVARVHNLGRPPRRLVRLQLDGSSDVLPPPGTDVLLDGSRVGFLGTAVHHHEQGPIALAMVKRTVPDDVVAVVEGMNARVEPLPGLSYADLAAPPQRPRLGAAG